MNLSKDQMVLTFALFRLQVLIKMCSVAILTIWVQHDWYWMENLPRYDWMKLWKVQMILTYDLYRPHVTLKSAGLQQLQFEPKMIKIGERLTKSWLEESHHREWPLALNWPLTLRWPFPDANLWSQKWHFGLKMALTWPLTLTWPWHFRWSLPCYDPTPIHSEPHLLQYLRYCRF